jgi:hypothetical protein
MWLRWPLQLIMGFGISWPPENIPKFKFLKPNSIFAVMIAQVSSEKYFSLNFGQAYHPANCGRLVQQPK